MRGGKQYLLVTDFDQTAAQTFASVKGIVGVDEAYRLGVQMVLGPAGLAAYEKIKGFGNMAPIELVATLLREGKADQMVLHAAGVFERRQQDQLFGLVPEGKGYPLQWGVRSSDPAPVIAELIVREKLRLLMQHISGLWPLASNGFLTLLGVLKKLRTQYQVNINLGIASSGHEMFILRVFEQWGKEPPLVLVTDDDVRGQCSLQEMQAYIKPSANLMDLVSKRWAQELLGESATELGIIGFTARNRKRMLYVGDDIRRDGELARNSEIPFIWFRQDGPPGGEECVTECMNDFEQLANRLLEPKNLGVFLRGGGFEEMQLY